MKILVVLFGARKKAGRKKKSDELAYVSYRVQSFNVKKYPIYGGRYEGNSRK